jgi:large subunit ribosomal protein L21
MFAIVNIKGKQYKVSPSQKLYVPKMTEEVGNKLKFTDVFMFGNDDESFEIGTPTLSKTVEATVLGHVKDDKVIVFKKKRRKNYKRTRGHRQQYTQILIDSIN